MNNQAFYLCGPDGSGKTTFLKAIERRLQVDGNKTIHIWLRSPKLFSKPLMAYCRVVGLTSYNMIDGVKYGKHEFYKSKFVSYLFPILQLIDFKIKWAVAKRKIKKDHIILFDRFSIDTLSDLMVDTKRFDLHRSWIGKSFMNLIPKNCKSIVLMAEDAIIRSRKKDTLHDEHLTQKIKVFEIIANDFNLNLIYNEKDLILVENDIFNVFDL